MQVYFNYSSRGVSTYLREYSCITRTLEKLGHYNNNPLDINRSTQEIYSQTDEASENMVADAVKKVRDAQVIILEVSMHSLTQGYIIYLALSLGIPVIALHLQNHTQAFTKGIKHEKFQLAEYTPDNITSVLKDCLKFAQESLDIRFNLFISPKINAYITQLSEERRDSKSNIVRSIIQEHMNKI